MSYTRSVPFAGTKFVRSGILDNFFYFRAPTAIVAPPVILTIRRLTYQSKRVNHLVFIMRDNMQSVKKKKKVPGGGNI